jgi:predicted CXXCH cytochrome family protein
MMKGFIVVLLLLSALLPAALFGQTYSGATLCSACHAGGSGGTQYTSWSTTLHSKAFDSIAVVQNDPACLPCHVTGWDTTLANGGFDDYYKTSDQAGMTKTKNVQCEDCHGPVQFGVNHGTPSTIKPQAETCGKCHEGEHHPHYSEWKMSRHSRSDSSDAGSFLTNMFRTDPNCSGCHTYQGFLQWVEDTVNIFPNVTPPGDAHLPMVCATCHNPHGSPNVAQLRMDVAKICTKCHNPEYDPDSAAVGQEVHHSTAYMFEGKGGYHYAGYTYTSSAHKFVVTKKCAECHVSTAPYQAGPPVIPAATGHTFDPEKRACASQFCHAATIDTTQPDSVAFDYKRAQTVSDSLANVLGGLLATATTSADSQSLGFLRAKFNYDFYEADGSRGVHNTAYAQGLLKSAIQNFSLTGVKQEDEPVPSTFVLKQNYPNPFNPSTIISFSLPGKSMVKVDVYDVTGKLISTLVNESMDRGTYSVTWDGNDSRGARVASGVYLYKMQAGNFISTKKMLMIK